MSQASHNRASNDSAPQFRLRGSRISMTELELLDYHPQLLAEQLSAQAQALPESFRQMPIIINLQALAQEQDLPDLQEVAALCKAAGINPIGVRADDRLDTQACYAAGLANFSTSRAAVVEPPVAEPVAPQPEPEPQVITEVVTEVKPQQSMVVTAPVRSGQQLYARGGDLIILAPVSAGAEVMADGNVHIYGALRGRAMAGVSGDNNARVFCQSMEAELVSIAGYFKTSEDLQNEHWRCAAQAYLSGSRLDVAPL